MNIDLTAVRDQIEATERPDTIIPFSRAEAVAVLAVVDAVNLVTAEMDVLDVLDSDGVHRAMEADDPDSPELFCARCVQDWPCSTARLSDALAQIEPS